MNIYNQIHRRRGMWGTNAMQPCIGILFRTQKNDLIIFCRQSEEYTYFCGYCTVGSDTFDVVVNHVIKIHGDLEVKIRKRTFNEKSQTFEHHFKQWKIHPNDEAEKGYEIKINNDVEQISLVKVWFTRNRNVNSMWFSDSISDFTLVTGEHNSNISFLQYLYGVVKFHITLLGLGTTQ